MQIIWAGTVAVNVILALLLVSRNHFLRHKWLTLWAVLSVLADPLLWFIHSELHPAYDFSLRLSDLLFIGLKLAIVFNERPLIRMPIELQLGIELAAYLVQRAGLLWPAYLMICGLRIYSLLVLCWIVFLFKGEVYEPRHKASRAS